MSCRESAYRAIPPTKPHATSRYRSLDASAETLPRNRFSALQGTQIVAVPKICSIQVVGMRVDLEARDNGAGKHLGTASNHPSAPLTHTARLPASYEMAVASVESLPSPLLARVVSVPVMRSLVVGSAMRPSAPIMMLVTGTSAHADSTMVALA